MGVTVQIDEGEAFGRGELHVTPRSRQVLLRGKLAAMALAWPHDVLIEDGGPVRRMPIRNATARLQAVLIGCGLLGAGAALVAQWCRGQPKLGQTPWLSRNR